MVAAAYLEDLNPSTKLALMAIADSSDEQTRDSAPGLAKIRAWSGLGRSQALAVVADLCQPIPDVRPAYLEHVGAGRRGRRAVYRVFPDGIPAIPHPTEVAARYEIPLSTPVDNPVGEGPEDWTLDLGQGPESAQQGPAQTGPLHASTSVSSAGATSRPPATAPAPPGRSGFPGARKPATEERPDPRTQRGHHDQPCPVGNHGSLGEVAGGCGRCAHAAVTSDPAKVAQARAEARAATRAARTPTAEPEEHTP